VHGREEIHEPGQAGGTLSEVLGNDVTEFRLVRDQEVYRSRQMPFAGYYRLLKR